VMARIEGLLFEQEVSAAGRERPAAGRVG
jgi:hypothetical protein